MDYIEINDQLKSMIVDLVNLGYKKTVIGKLLLGSSGYAPIVNYIDEKSEIDTELNLGVKPLTKVGNSVGYELRLVYVKNDNSDMINGLQEANHVFFEELRAAIINYMNSETYTTRKPYTITKKRKNEFESALDDILSSEILGTLEVDNAKLE